MSRAADIAKKVWNVLKIIFYVAGAWIAFVVCFRFLKGSPPTVKAVIDEKGIKVTSPKKKPKVSNKDLARELEKLR